MERFLIWDIEYSIGIQNQISEEFDLKILDANLLTKELLSWDGWKIAEPSSTLLVLPGNGAGIVRSYLTLEWLASWRWVAVPAKRFWRPGESPHVTVGRIYPHGMMFGINDVIIIDDVVSSSETTTKLRQFNEPWIPNARWHVVVWVAQRKASISRSLRRFTSVYASVWVGNIQSFVSVNSLSTLLREPVIAESYTQRHMGSKTSAFLALLADIRLATT
ncbi:MAG: hypothetical protein V1712_02005 [Patescibacteria group bacterium]